MRKIVGFCIASAICALPTVAAQAKTYTVEEAQSRYLQCYDQQYVPATVAVNTRGRLVRAGARALEVNGNQWNYVYNPPVYIQTRHIVEPDHYTLVGTACPTQ